MMKKCIRCNSKLIGKQTKFCCKKCCDIYHHSKNKKYYRAKAKEWNINNPERSYQNHKKALAKFRHEKRDRFNELMRNHYKRNKQKYSVRANTNLYRDKFINALHSRCQNCGSKQNLELHHLQYIWYKEFELNVKNLRLLCTKCHGKAHIKTNI